MTASTAIFTYSFQGSLLLLLFSCSKVSDYSSCTTKLGNPHPSIQTGHFDAVSKQRNEENEEPAEESNISKVKDGYRPRGPLAAFKLQRPRETTRRRRSSIEVGKFRAFVWLVLAIGELLVLHTKAISSLSI